MNMLAFACLFHHGIEAIEQLFMQGWTKGGQFQTPAYQLITSIFILGNVSFNLITVL